MEIQFVQLVGTLRRLWWVPVALVLVLGLLGLALGRITSGTYTATTSMLVTTQVSGDDVLTESGGATTYQNLVTSGPVLDLVIIDLDLAYTRAELAPMVTSTVVRNTQIIRISVTSDNPEEAADIANAVTRNFVTVATELSVSELQRNLDGLKSQADTTRNQIVVYDTQIATLEADNDADSTESKAELDSLKRDRLQAAQTLADLEASIRDLTTQLNTMSIPVVVTDFAQAPEKADSVSPVLLALVGAFVGGLVGAAVVVGAAVMDRRLRDTTQLALQPIIATVAAPRLITAGSSESTMLASLLASIDPALTSIALVSADGATDLAPVASALSVAEGTTTRFVAAGNALNDPAAMRTIPGADAVVVVATRDASDVNETNRLANLVATFGKPVLGSIMLTGK